MSGNGTFVALRDGGRLAFWRIRMSSVAKITTAAFILCILGWSLLWAQALSVVELVPQWVCTLMFFIGIALIPFRRMATHQERAAGD